MSAIFNNAGDGLNQANNVAASSLYTCVCWAKLTATFTDPDYVTVVLRMDGVYVSSSGILFYEIGGNIFPRLDVYDGVTAVFADGPQITVDQWVHLGYVKSGTTHRLYVNGVLVDSTTLNINANTYDTLYGGYDGFSLPNLEISNFREWDDALGTQEIVDEMNSAIPVSELANLITDTPLTSDLLDDSGNGNDWGSTGSITFGTSIAIPAAASAAGAIDITPLPFNEVIDLVVEGVAFDRWYKHTGTGTYCLGIWGFGNLIGITPNVTVFESDMVTPWPAVGAINANNIPLQVPFTIGLELFFKFTPNSRAIGAFSIEVDALESDHDSIPLGSICVPDDNDAGGFHLAILSAVNGDDYNVLDFKEFPCSENADILDNGMILVHDKTDNELKIRNADYTNFMDLGTVVMASTLGCIRQCRGTQRWWILYLEASTYKVRYVEDDGTLGTAHNVAALASSEDPDSLAVNNDESILYYGENTTGSRSVKNFNLATDTLIGTFATGPTGSHVAVDILVLSDDSIVVFWSRGVGQDIVIIQYDSTGAVLSTKNLGSAFIYPSGILGRMAYALDDPNSIWAWTHLASPAGVSRFQNIELSTGNILAQIDQQQYEEGEYNSVATATPERFGNSFSCPFWVATSGVAPISTLTVIKESEPDSLTHDFIVDVASGLLPAQLTLQNGDSHTYTPVTPGTYSVVEQPDNDWRPLYTVSNDVNNNNLAVVVGVGEDVVVTILNMASTPGGGVYELTPTNPGGSEPSPSKPNDDFSNGDGSVTVRGIPPPFIITGFIRDA